MKNQKQKNNNETLISHKKDNKFQITMPELQKIIKEEYESMAKDMSRVKEIEARLSEINKELESTPGTLSEVEASGTKKTKSTGWSGEGGDVKFGEKFEKIGTHLKEDEEMDGELEMGGEEEEMGDDSGMGYFEAKFAELGRELDQKVGGEGPEMDSIEVDSTEISDEAPEEEEMEEVVAEMEETSHEDLDGPKVNPEALSEEEVVAEEEEIVAEEESLNEDLEEPIEGETPAQDSEARFNDYMEKDKHVKEGAESKGTSLLSEGFTPEKKSKLDSELERMKQLAKINR